MQPFGRYELLERIGIGGMAEVYRAVSSGTAGINKQLVIKKILPHLSEDDHFRQMFLNEAKIAVNLTHANIVQVFDFGEVDGQYFLAMEWVDGTDLRQVLKDLYKANSRIPLPYALYIAAEVCKGLDYAHRKAGEDGKPLGIIHRDISPQNILISVEGEVKIADFGIAKAANVATETRSGAIKGKLSYLAPEHISKGLADRRSDLFALGVCLHEMLTGKPLFAGRGELEILKRIESGEYPSPSQVEPWLPKNVDDLVMKALERQPGDRYQIAADFHEAIGDIAFEAGARLEPSGLASFVREHFKEGASGSGPKANPDNQGQTNISSPSVKPPAQSEASMNFLTKTSHPGTDAGPQDPPAVQGLGLDDGESQGPPTRITENHVPPMAPPTSGESFDLESITENDNVPEPTPERPAVMPKERPMEERSARSLTIPPSRRPFSFVGTRRFGWGRFAALGGVGIAITALVVVIATGILPVQEWATTLAKRVDPNTTGTPMANRVNERLEEFRAKYEGVSGTADDYVMAGREQLKDDTITGYMGAREDLERALALDGDHALAFAALAEVYALLARYNSETQLLADAIQFADRSRQLQADLPQSYRAEAAVLALTADTSSANAIEARKILERKVLGTQKNDPSAMFFLGVALTHTDSLAAESALRKVIQETNMNRAHYELGIMLRNQNRWREAVRELQKVRRKLSVADLARGDLLERMGRYREAVAAYRDAAGNQPQNPKLVAQAELRAAIVHYQSLNSTTQAERSLDRAAASLQEGSDKPLHNRVRVHLAHVARLQKRLPRSEQLAAEVLRSSDRTMHPAAHYALGIVQLRRKQYEEAESSFRSALKGQLGKRDRASVLYYLAVTQVGLNAYEDARTQLAEATRLDPNNSKSAVYDGYILAKQQKNYPAAVDRLYALGRQNPFYYQDCRCFTDFVGDNTFDPYRAAAGVFEKLAKEKFAYDAKAWSALGIARFHARSRTQAWEAFDRAHQEDSSDEVARVFRGVRYELMGSSSNLKSAALEYEAAKRSDFKSPFVYTELAKIYASQGQIKKAEGNIARALSEDPGYPPALYWQGKVREKRGDRRGALTNWSRALEVDPSFTPAAQAIYALGS